ncbi:hypothetical protein LEP1GSC059_2308 [Leptospira noguchii serovar Panama str. CZ214]|uniref:Uncharacterized protein n=1 Tax=Leptospira noguchii serovar Panama str. CZ214 TaxID=1001595 RepID=T0GQN5_9LEPT|nr:hypothetical protein LEP1GSC059_2308 [Leptospira noguchii serovar Panama str. CZ214]
MAFYCFWFYKMERHLFTFRKFKDNDIPSIKFLRKITVR